MGGWSVREIRRPYPLALWERGRGEGASTEQHCRHGKSLTPALSQRARGSFWR
jgi:hypothetical protein